MSSSLAKRKRSRKQIAAAKKNIKKAQKKSPSAQAKPNVFTNGRDFDIAARSVKSFFDTHNKAQEIYMHAILHAPAGESVPKKKRKQLHDAIVRKHFHKHVPTPQRLKVHGTPI